MVLLNRKKQLAVAIEAVSGTFNTAGVANVANATIIPIDLAPEFDIERIEREVVRNSITPVRRTTGRKAAQIPFGVEIQGAPPSGAHASGAPPWGLLLRSAGMRQVEIRSVPIDAVTDGPLRHGEIVTQATTNATARVVGDVHNGATVMYLEKASITGSPDTSNDWTGGSTGAVAGAAAGTIADEGFAWYPITDPTKQITLDAVSSAFTAGTIFQGVTSGARGEVVTTLGAPGTLYYKPIRGSFTAGETLAGLGSSSAAGTVDDPAGEAFVDWPTLSARVYHDGTSIDIAGARAQVVFQFDVNRPARMIFTLRGRLHATGDVAMLSGIAYDARNPPAWQGAAISFADNEDPGQVDLDAEVPLCLTSLGIDLGVQLADRLCAGAAEGLLEVRGSGRQGTVTMDPEATREADVPLVTMLRTAKLGRLRATLGSSDGNRFTLLMPGVDLESIGTQERDGLSVRDVRANLTGGNLNNLDGAAVTLDAFGGDNELVLIYHTA